MRSRDAGDYLGWRPIHRSQIIKEFLADGAAERLHLERLPAYAPELNAGEGLWAQLKGIELHNLCCFNIPHLRHELRDAVRRVRQDHACFTAVSEGQNFKSLRPGKGNAPQLYERETVYILGRPLAELMFAHVSLHAGDRVLDAACGTGIVTRVAVETGVASSDTSAAWTSTPVCSTWPV